MPGKDFDLDADIDATLAAGMKKPAAAPTFDLDADIDATLAGALEPKQSKVIEMPVQHIEGSAPLTPAPKPENKPWYARFLPNADAALHGAAQGATANFSDEGAAGILAALPNPKDPEGFTREYKAGSQYADTHNVLDAENHKLAADHPLSYGAGQLVGGTPAALATGAGVAAAARPMLAAKLSAVAAPLAETALTGAALGGAAGTGDAAPGSRFAGGVEGAAAGALGGAVMHGVGSGLGETAQNLKNTSNALLTQTFMTPAQRYKYQAAKGKGSLDKLGQDAWDTGLFGGTLRRLLPNRARGVASRAAENMEQSGADINKFEDNLAARGINPDVNIRPIVDDLRSTARAEDVPTLKSPGVVRTINKAADRLEQPETVSVPGKREAPPALPEWALSKPSRPQYGAAIEPQQEPLPGTELPPVAADRPVPPAATPEQLSMPTPRAMPDKQLSLGLDPQQAKLPLPPAEATKQTRPQMTLDQLPVRLPSGGSAQENMFLGSEPAKPPVAQQGGAAQPAQQPVQGQLPTAQLSLPGVPAKPAAPAENPLAALMPAKKPSPLAGRQESLGLENPNRGPQPELSTPLPDSTAQVTRDTLPLDLAMRTKRALGKEINWTQNLNTPGTRAEDIVNKTSWKGIGDQIDAALQGDSRVNPDELANYNQAKKTFHTAATAFDPALRMAEREGEMGLGARDFMAAGALGGGPIGGVAAVANKTLAGALPSTGAIGLRGAGKVSTGLGALLKTSAKISPITIVRQQNPGASDAEVKRKANDQVKQELQRQLEQARQP